MPNALHTVILVSVAALSASASAAEPKLSFQPWGSFTSTSSPILTPLIVDRMTVETAQGWAGAKPTTREFWVVERRTTTTTDAGSNASLRWADSRTCPSLIPELAALANLEPVSILPPGVKWPAGRDHDADASPRQLRQERDETVFDAGTYEIDAPGHWAKARMTGSVVLRGATRSPAANWVEHTMKALEPCWSSTPPG